VPTIFELNRGQGNMLAAVDVSSSLAEGGPARHLVVEDDASRLSDVELLKAYGYAVTTRRREQAV